MKGDFNDKCNRTDCDNGSAVYYNKSTRKYYCKICAHIINMHNRADSMRLYGEEDLCTVKTESIDSEEETFNRGPYAEEVLTITNEYADLMYADLEKCKPLKRGHYAPVRTDVKIGNNDTCNCGSGKKYKKCCK